MDANSEFAVTALSEASIVPSILFGVCSTLPYPMVDIGHVGFCCWRYKDANLEFAVHWYPRAPSRIWLGWLNWSECSQGGGAPEIQRCIGVLGELLLLGFLLGCMEKVRFAFHSITVKVSTGLFCYSFFQFVFLSCRLIQGSRRFSCCVSGFWVGVSCSGAPYIHRCIGVLRKLLGLGMGFLLTCEEMVCTDFYSITVWLLTGFFCYSFLAALSSSRSLVVGWLVCLSVRRCLWKSDF